MWYINRTEFYMALKITISVWRDFDKRNFQVSNFSDRVECRKREMICIAEKQFKT